MCSKESHDVIMVGVVVRMTTLHDDDDVSRAAAAVRSVVLSHSAAKPIRERRQPQRDRSTRRDSSDVTLYDAFVHSFATPVCTTQQFNHSLEVVTRHT